MNGLCLDSGEFISADELNARWLPRKATEEEMIEKQPEAMQLPTLPFAVFDEFGQPCEDRVRDHFAASFEALRAQIGQGDPVNGEWVERWHGSKTDEGWSILFQSLVPRDKVAYLGTGVSAEAVQSIVYAHNQALSAQQQKPLTDDEIRRIELTVHGYTRQPLDVKKFARAIEAAHNIG